MCPHFAPNHLVDTAQQVDTRGTVAGCLIRQPMRTCVGCGRKAARNTLIRVVADARYHLVVDWQRNMPGRGAWVHPAPECQAAAQQRRAFPRLLKLPPGAPAPREEFWHELALAALSEALPASTYE